MKLQMEAKCWVTEYNKEKKKTKNFRRKFKILNIKVKITKFKLKNRQNKCNFYKYRS